MNSSVSTPVRPRRWFLPVALRRRLFVAVAGFLGMNSAVDWEWLTYCRDFERKGRLRRRIRKEIAESRRIIERAGYPVVVVDETHVDAAVDVVMNGKSSWGKCESNQERTEPNVPAR